APGNHLSPQCRSFHVHRVGEMQAQMIAHGPLPPSHRSPPIEAATRYGRRSNVGSGCIANRRPANPSLSQPAHLLGALPRPGAGGGQGIVGPGAGWRWQAEDHTGTVARGRLTASLVVVVAELKIVDHSKGLEQAPDRP